MRTRSKIKLAEWSVSKGYCLSVARHASHRRRYLHHRRQYDRHHHRRLYRMAMLMSLTVAMMTTVTMTMR